MVIERALALTLALGAAGCASTSTQSDFRAIREVADVAVAPELGGEAVELEIHEDVRALLSEGLDADTAARVAILNNRELRATLREVGIARGQYVQAGLLPNPGFEFDVREPGENGAPLQLDFLVEWNLTDALLAPRRARAARAELEAVRYGAAASVVQAGYGARVAFIDFLTARARLELAVQSLDAYAASRDAANMLFEAGNISELVVASEDAAYEEAAVLVAELELELVVAREAVQRALGLFGDDTAWESTEALEPPPAALELPDDLERESLERSFALAAMRHRLESTARQTGIARTEGWLPDITVDAHTERDADNWEVGGGAFVVVPLFDRQQGARAALEASFDAQLERYLGHAVDVRSHARELAARVRSAHARARHYEDAILPARQRVLEQALLQYNAMQINVFELITAKRALLDAELRRAEARRNYWTARAAMDALLTGHGVSAPEVGGAVSMGGGASGDAGGH